MQKLRLWLAEPNLPTLCRKANEGALIGAGRHVDEVDIRRFRSSRGATTFPDRLTLLLRRPRGFPLHEELRDRARFHAAHRFEFPASLAVKQFTVHV